MSQNKYYEQIFFDNFADTHGGSHIGIQQAEFIINSLLYCGLWPKGEMLECGCGVDGYGNYIAQTFKGLNVTGVDISQKTVAIANRKKTWAIFGDIENERLFSSKTFDLILCPFVLHHLPGMDKTINNIYQWLKPDGIFIIMDINPTNPLFRISNFCRKIFEVLGGKGILLRHSLATPNETTHNMKTYLRNTRGYKLLFCDRLYIEQKINSHFALFNNALHFFFPGSIFSEHIILMIFKKKDLYYA